MAGFSSRVFRRNNKKIIILWDASQLDSTFTNPVIASVIGVEGKDTPLTYSQFKPDNPEKFSRDIDGIVISHLSNNLDPNKEYKVKLVFHGQEDSCETIQEVLPATVIVPTETTRVTEVVHMYAYDYKNRKWVPLPVDQRLVD